jgi:cytochrome c5
MLGLVGIRVRVGLLTVVVWAVALASSVPTAEAPRPQAALTAAQKASAPAVDPRALLDKYCVGCHNSRASTTATVSGVVFDTAWFVNTAVSLPAGSRRRLTAAPGSDG